jgi:hypothetical protein
MLHPLNTEAVDYLSQRTELMMGFFYFLTMYASVRAHASARPAPWLAAAVLTSARLLDITLDLLADRVTFLKSGAAIPSEAAPPPPRGSVQ